MTVFVVLHYLVYDETVKCVDSILNNIRGDRRVVVVDNCSPNDSFVRLRSKYGNTDTVDIIQNKSNSGYASGINLGYSYAKDRYEPDFIVCMNNDMEILQEEFIENIEAAYSAYPFYVLGPDIYSTSRLLHQNPDNDVIRTPEDVERHIRDIKRIQNNRLKLKIKGILYSIRPLRKLYYRLKSRPVENRVMENVALHGSCYIFSGSFIKNRDHALNPGTFMYCESQILDYECMRDGMLTIYCPSVRILHHEDVATDAAGGSYEEKLLKKCDRVLESLYYMKDMMLKDSGEI